MSFLENAIVLKEQIDKNQNIVDRIEKIGGMRMERTQSDKVGFDWGNYYVNNILVKQVYVEQRNPIGVKSNPFVWNESLQLIQNAFYIYEDVVKVWMGKAGVLATWDDENFVEW